MIASAWRPVFWHAFGSREDGGGDARDVENMTMEDVTFAMTLSLFLAFT